MLFSIDKSALLTQLLAQEHWRHGVACMTRNMRTTVVPLLLASILAVSAGRAQADDAVTLSLTIKDHQFEPAEVHAPAGQPIAIRVKHLGSTAAEFESNELHVEKGIAAGGEAV